MVTLDEDEVRGCQHCHHWHYEGAECCVCGEEPHGRVPEMP
jgi:hypothetical protein